MNKNFYKNKKILITGCTGFTGSWLILYFRLHGAKIYGYSENPPFKNSIFETLSLKHKITYLNGDICDLKKLNKFYKKSKPDFIFHLAANPIVKRCYENPLEAYYSNSIGTLNLLEIIRVQNNQKKISLNIITTDKVYKNINSQKKFVETDYLGGDDPYSSSKVCSELICETYYKSYFTNKKININMLRSGNIIGGGDWSKDRLLPDIIKSYFEKKNLIIRNPKHIRPWQHIFDVIKAYSDVATKIYNKKNNNFSAWNIGPNDKKKFNVIQIVNMIEKKLNSKIKKKFIKTNILEKKYLRLNSQKIYNKLKIKNKLSTIEAINLTLDWYLNFYKKKNINYSENQLKNYINEKN